MPFNPGTKAGERFREGLGAGVVDRSSEMLACRDAPIIGAKARRVPWVQAVLPRRRIRSSEEWVDVWVQRSGDRETETSPEDRLYPANRTTEEIGNSK